MPSPDEKHPIIAGLIALVSVTAAVGVIVAVAAALGSHLVHPSGSGTGGSSGDGASLFVPMPKPTKAASGPLVTLSADPSASSSSSSSSSSSTSSAPKHKKKKINLTASVVSATAMQQFQISGTYPGGEGHILRLQRKMAGSGWATFGIPDMDVQGGQFSSSVQTGHTGQNFFRVVDVDTKLASNVVKVSIG